MKITKEEALEYHSRGKKGKLEIKLTKPCDTQRDLSLAYTPGVAEPCLEIQKDPLLAYEYTAKGNLVAVISNGTAVLGLGNIGALAGKPVMEGKCVLFKKFADVDAIDIEINTEDIEEFIKTCKLISPTFGGINLEDIKAPECFEIEERLKAELDIPVFHDDQHGTAIISGAALLNALELVGKKIDQIKVVFNGAGASSIACAKFYLLLGVKKENIIMCDTKGVIYKGRKDGMNVFKEEFAIETDKRTLAEALEGADVFVGLSIGKVVTKEMVKKMADKPIIFAMANPIPEISYEDAKEARPDGIIATGRSDYPNQINNVLGFPFIFRGALDVRAMKINNEMKLAAAKALAELAKEDVPDSVAKAYGVKRLEFGKDYIIPKPLDPRVLYWEAPEVAKAAIETKVAQIKIDIDEYRERLKEKVMKGGRVMSIIIQEAKKRPIKVVYAEGEHEKIIRAANIVSNDEIAKPILLGREEIIKKKIESLKLNFDYEIIDPALSNKRDQYAEKLFKIRERKGITKQWAYFSLSNPIVFGSMMVYEGDAHGLIAGLTTDYANALRPILQIIKTEDNVKTVAGLYVVIVENEVFFFADATVNIDPDSETIAEIAALTANFAKELEIEPKVAFLSFSNFGSVRVKETEKVSEAVKIFKKKYPHIIAEGEMQADTALVPEITEEFYPFSLLKGKANVLIFPNLDSANISYKILQRLGNAQVIGPILLGTKMATCVLQKGDDVQDIVNMTAVVAREAQMKIKC
ncbi:MAG: NADP-dependent malic enzyme [Candidatus Hydrothermales bacterium]